MSYWQFRKEFDVTNGCSLDSSQNQIHFGHQECTFVLHPDPQPQEPSPFPCQPAKQATLKVKTPAEMFVAPLLLRRCRRTRLHGRRIWVIIDSINRRNSAIGRELGRSECPVVHIFDSGRHDRLEIGVDFFRLIALP